MMKTYRMNTLGKVLSVVVLMTALLTAPSLASSHINVVNKVEETTTAVDRAAEELAAIMAEAGSLYSSMNLENLGLAKNVFEYAFLGYNKMLEEDKI